MSHHLDTFKKPADQATVDKCAQSVQRKLSLNNMSSSEEENDLWDDAKEEQPTEDETISSVNDFPKPSSSAGLHTNFLASKCTTDPAELILHKAVFENDSNQINSILSDVVRSKELVNKRDKHGNTPLHLACMLGRSHELISALLQSGAAIDCKNLHRWTPYHEACSYGNRDVLHILTQQLKYDVQETLNKTKFSKNLERTRDYVMSIKWEFQSWVPLIARVLPSDTCIIYKQGNCIRIDTRLLDFEMLSWKKGESCLIYSNKFKHKWIIMNNKTKRYQHFDTQCLYKDNAYRVDDIMSTDIMDVELKSTDIQFTRSTCGWIWKADKTEKIGKYNAALYNCDNVFLVTRKRREHMSETDIKRNKMAFKGAVHILKFGTRPNLRDFEDASSQDFDGEEETDNSTVDEQTHQRPKHRESLPPPEPKNVTWSEYTLAEPGKHPCLGREHKYKESKTAFKAGVAMSDQFPLSKQEFLDLLSIVPLKLFKKLKEFIEIRLPDGFPIRLDVPIFPFLIARITFEDFTFHDGPVDESLFTIPADFVEDPDMFPFLSGRQRRHAE